MKNKLFKRRSQQSECPEHPGKCTANLKLQDPIGKEDQATEETCREFLNDREPTATLLQMETVLLSVRLRGPW
jgi:hypothetical protein